MRSIAKMNQIFKINLKMVTEENKDYARYRTLYEDAIKQSTDVESEVPAKWRSTRRKY